MSEMKKANHSLSAEIAMMLKTEGADKVVNDLFDISDTIVEMTEPVKAFTRAFKELEDSPLKGLAESLKDFKIDSVSVNAQNLREVLSDKIATAISKAKIEFIGKDTPERYPFKVMMGEEFWKKNQKSVAEAMSEAFINLEVDPSNIPPLDTTEIIKGFQAKFNEQIIELMEDSDVFSLFRQDPKKHEYKYKYKRRFEISKEAVNNIMGAIESEFIRVLSDPENILLHEVPKLEIKSEELRKAMDAIQESIGDIDKLIGVDPDTLKELPNIEIKLVKFRDNLDKMVQEINVLAEQLESITFGEVTTQDIENTIKTIYKMKAAVTTEIEGWVTAIAKEIKEDLNIRPNLAVFKESLKGLNTFFESVLQDQLERLKKDVDNIVSGMDGGYKGKQAVAERSIDITQLIVNVIEKELIENNIPITLKGSELVDIFNNWTEQVDDNIRVELINMLGFIEDGIYKTIETISEGIEGTFDEYITEINTILDESKEGISESDVRVLSSNVKREIHEYVIRVMQNFTLAGMELSEEQIILPKSINNDVKSIITRHVFRLVEQIKEGQELTGYTKDEVDKVTTRLNKHSTMLTNAVVRDVNQNLTNIRKDFLGLEGIDGSSTTNLKEILFKSVNSIVTTAINVLENAVNNIIVTDEGLIELQKQIESSFGKIIGSISLDGSAFDGVTEEIEYALEEIKIEINNIFKKYVKEIESVAKRLEIFSNTSSEGLTDLSGGDLHKVENDLIKIMQELMGEIGKVFENINESSKRIKSNVGLLLDESIEQLSRIDTESISLGDKDITEEISRLNKHTAMIVNAVLREVNKKLSETRKEFLHQGNIEADSTKNLNEEVNRRARGIIDNIYRDINKALEDIHITEADMNEFKGRLTKLIDNIVNVDEMGGAIGEETNIYEGIYLAIKDGIDNILNEITFEVTNLESLNIDLVDEVETLKEVIRVKLDKVIRESIKKIRSTEIEDINITIRTKQLQNNIDSLIQKVINEKAKQITAHGNLLAKQVSLNVDLFKDIENKVDEIINNIIAKYSIAAEKLSSAMYGNEEIKTVYNRMYDGFSNTFNIILDNITDNLKEMVTMDYSIPTKSLQPQLRRIVADYLGTGVRELLKSTPEIEGKEVQRIVMQKNIDTITKMVNDLIQHNIKSVVSSYKASLKDVEIKPDQSLAGFIFNRLRELQDNIIRKAREMVRSQFKYLTEEIKGMNIEARSLGYKPTKAFTREVEKATGVDRTKSTTSVGGVGVVAEGDVIGDSTQQPLEIRELITNASNVTVDGSVVELKASRLPIDSIRLDIDDYSKLTGLPNDLSRINFSPDPRYEPEISNMLRELRSGMLDPANVHTDGYRPFNINDIYFRKGGEDEKGLFEGITSNMVKYFMVGYMLRLPIKAITEANKIASKLDYHITKARQNILIKDPTMTSTARRIVYDRYATEGLDVGSPQFSEDVELEAGRLRSVMDNEMSGYLLNISKAFNQQISSVGRFYSIASRRSKDPYEALTKTREIAKIAAVEEDLDLDFAASGLEAIAAQWGVHVGDLDRYTNMMLKTAMLSNTTVNDLLSAQRDTAGMFRERLSNLDDEEAFASAMVLSSMFTESTGKTGREAGTFWKNILQKPYVKDGRKFLEEVSQLEGFEDLDPYFIDELGNRVQKDFITMFSNILEAAMRVDDPTGMRIMSEIFPVRTMGGVESITALLGELRLDLEQTIQELKDIGELDADATVDTVNIKDVIDKYVENVMEVTDEDIGMYLAGLQTTTRYDVMGLQTQWQSTVYSVFKEMQSDTSTAMTYFTYILRKFEENSNHMAEVIKMFMTIGVGYLGKRGIYDRIMSAGEEALLQPTDTQGLMAAKYQELQAMEKAFDLRGRAISKELRNVMDREGLTNETIENLYTRKDTLDKEIRRLEEQSQIRELTYDEESNLRDMAMHVRIYNDQIMKLENNLGVLAETKARLETMYDTTTAGYADSVVLGKFLGGSMGARTTKELEESFSSYLKMNELYGEIAPFTIRSQVGIGDDEYEQLFKRKREIEDHIIDQQRYVIGQVESVYGKSTPEELSNILGKDYGDDFYMVANRLSEKSRQSILKIAETFAHRFGEDFELMQDAFNMHYRELNEINKTLMTKANPERFAMERAIFEATRPEFLGYTEDEDGVLTPSTRPISPEESVKRYRELLPSFGINLDRFESGVDEISKMFVDGKFDVDKYEDSLREVATRLGIAEKDFLQFKTIISEVNMQVRDGNKAIYEYIAALKSITHASSGGVAYGNLVSEGGMAGTEDGSSVSTIGMGAVTSVTGARTGILSRILQGLGLTSIGTKLSSVAARIGATKIGMGGAAIAKGLMAKVPPLLAIYATSRVIGSAISGMTERGMDDIERMTIEANKLDSTIKRATGLRVEDSDGFLSTVGKSTMGLITVVGSSITNQINRMFGGAAPSFADTWDIYLRGMRGGEFTREEMGNRLRGEYEVDLKRLRANYEKQRKYLEETPFVDPITGETREKGDPHLDYLPLEELLEYVNKVMTGLNRDILRSDIGFTKERVELLLRGLSSNSIEMRDAIIRNMDRNIDRMNEVVDEFREHLSKLRPGEETYVALETQIEELEGKIAEAELQKFDTRFRSAYDEIMDRFGRETSKIQSRYDIKRYEALIRGIKEDSGAIRQLDKKMSNEQVKLITGIQSRLEVLRQQFADKPDQEERILIQIQQLEADKKKILAEIRDKVSQGISTFNLPSGIRPITYYEAMTRDNTHRNVTVRAGEAVVNINIDTMTGSDQDMERLGKTVSNAVSQAQRNFVRQFANDVKSGMGNNYYSWNS